METIDKPLTYDRVIRTKFAPAIDHPTVALLKLILCNISGRAIIYKIENKNRTFFTAESSASGKIPAHGISSCLLIWQRPSKFNNWKDVKPTSLVMITKFEGSDDPYINEHAITKIKCRVSSSSTCDCAHPPEVHVTFRSSMNSSLSAIPNSTENLKTGKEAQNLTNIVSNALKHAMNIENLQKTNSQSIDSMEQIQMFYLEAKGAIIILLVIVILLMCFNLLFTTKSVEK